MSPQHKNEENDSVRPLWVSDPQLATPESVVQIFPTWRLLHAWLSVGYGGIIPWSESLKCFSHYLPAMQDIAKKGKAS